jgi:hypothetical protein
MIVYHCFLSSKIVDSISWKYSQSIVFSAQSAVFDISLRGGVGVFQQRISFSNPAPSALRKIAPTFCIERIESRRTILEEDLVDILIFIFKIILHFFILVIFKI